MQNAVKDTKAMTVVSQDQMLEKLQHSEVRGQSLSWAGFKNEIYLNKWVKYDF